MSTDNREYNRFMGLLNDEQVATVSSATIHECIKERVCASLGTQAVYRIVHDGCDIRKPDSTVMEYLGTDAMSLDHQPLRGYKTMNSILIDADRQGVSLLVTELYSNKMPNYIGQTMLNAPETLSTAQKTLVAEEAHINTKVAFFKNAKRSSEMIKAQDAVGQRLHIADRGHDDAETFEYINDDLEDVFIIRCKDSRLSHLTYPTYTPSGKLSKRVAHYKLIDKIFAHSGEYEVAAITIKGKKYENVTARIAWETVVIGEHSYTAVRCALYGQDGEPLFKQPMLLITNGVVGSIEEAKEVYLNYLLRSKIEIVFRFLKQYLGWETFQIRDFNAIRNLLALAFFLVGYFHELQDALVEDPLILKLCALAHSKGIVSIHFILKGLAVLAAAQLVEQWKREHNITQTDIHYLLTLFSP